MTQRRVIREVSDGEGAADPVIAVIHVVDLPVVLALDEVRQHVVVGPARVAQPRPVVEVLGRAPHVRHAVHHRGAAEDLSSSAGIMRSRVREIGDLENGTIYWVRSETVR